MKSLQWRMLAALGLVIALAWGISIAMFASYVTAGPSNAWRSGLYSLGNRLISALPDKWNVAQTAPAGSAEHPLAHASAASKTISEPASMLTAMFLNTIELAIVGVLMWWAVVTSLRPLRAMSEEIARRKAFDSEPLSAEKVPDELRPLILAFNALLARVDNAMRAERQFIADAAHELRTPLAALQMQGEVALRAATPERKNEALRKLLDVSQRTHRLADQLLDLARLDAGLHATGLDDVDLMALCRHVLDEFAVQAAAQDTRLQLSGAACLVRCDVDEMGILIRNLVDNALRHGRPSGVVEVRCGDTDREGRRHPMLEVADDGPGVPEAEREAIFTRFYRASAAATQGSGIGLSLVASIARLHDATIETGPGELGQGLRIRILFPAR
ncbi:sensor histidine kinase [Dyella acidiphila]|uniref:histidine kinase n=1 Tax=Dyella acidiphila TaxID=2775866 RepID=A0ABR9GBL4_9GAMM|nr:ATP-binding protein [Dyella acidiphila]MBE1161404.1 two-component sensor histidine kinase [Dyella acidiphila]